MDSGHHGIMRLSSDFSAGEYTVFLVLEMSGSGIDGKDLIRKKSLWILWQKITYPLGFSHADFAPLFKTKLFDRSAWAELFSDAI